MACAKRSPLWGYGWRWAGKELEASGRDKDARMPRMPECQAYPRVVALAVTASDVFWVLGPFGNWGRVACAGRPACR